MDETLSAEERLATERLAELCREHFAGRLDRILLYGSRARGDVHEDSDIDILVVLADEPVRQDRAWLSESSHTLALSGKAFIDLSARLVSAARLNESIQRELLFGLEVRDQGIAL